MTQKHKFGDKVILKKTMALDLESDLLQDVLDGSMSRGEMDTILNHIEAGKEWTINRLEQDGTYDLEQEDGIHAGFGATDDDFEPKP